MHVEYEQRGQLGRGYHPAPIHSLNDGYHQMADGGWMTGSTHGPGSEYVTGGEAPLYGPTVFGGGTFRGPPSDIPDPFPPYWEDPDFIGPPPYGVRSVPPLVDLPPFGSPGYVPRTRREDWYGPGNLFFIPEPEESSTGGGWSTGRSLNEILGPGTYLPGGVFEPGYVPIPRIPADAPGVGYDGIPYGEKRARGLSQPHEVDVSFGPTFGYPDWMEDTEGEPARVGLGWRILW
jgi:hypothetical protein